MGGRPPPESTEDEVGVDDLLVQLEDLEDHLDSESEREELRVAMRLARRLEDDSIFGERIKKYTGRDMAEAFVGAIIFSVPLLVEDGVFDIAEHFTATTTLGVPWFLLGNLAFIGVMTYGLIYWADLQQVHISRPILGVFPRRYVGVLLISFLTAAAMMTLWGRVDGWREPVVALARISVVWTVAAFGAALGDILPGESEGKDINEVIEDLGE